MEDISGPEEAGIILNKTRKIQKDHLSDLLRATIAVNPFEAAHGELGDRWNEVSLKFENVHGYSVGGISVQRKVMKLLENHKKKVAKDKTLSGVAGEYTEAEQALDELVELEVEN